jgi:hypothetical protein
VVGSPISHQENRGVQISYLEKLNCEVKEVKSFEGVGRVKRGRGNEMGDKIML